MKIDWKKIEWRHVILPLGGWRTPLAYGLFHLITTCFSQALGGTPGCPVPTDWLPACLLPSMFPMFYLGDSIGDWLKPYLSDNGVAEMFAAINALFWAHLLTWGLSRLAKGAIQGPGEESTRA